MALGLAQIPSGDGCQGCCEQSPCTLRTPRWSVYAKIPDDGNQKPTLYNSYLLLSMNMRSCQYGTTGDYDCFGFAEDDPPKWPDNGWQSNPIFSEKLFTFDYEYVWSRTGRPDGLDVELTFEDNGTKVIDFETYQRLTITKIKITRDGNTIVWNIDPESTGTLIADYEDPDTSIDCVYYSPNGLAGMPVFEAPDDRTLVKYSVRIWEESELPETLTATINNTGNCSSAAANDPCSTVNDMCDRLKLAFDLEVYGTPTTVDGRVTDTQWAVTVSGNDVVYNPAWTIVGGWPWSIFVNLRLDRFYVDGLPFDADFEGSGGTGPFTVRPIKLSIERWDDTQEDAYTALNVTWRWKAEAFPSPNNNDCGGPVASGTMVITE